MREEFKNCVQSMAIDTLIMNARLENNPDKEKYDRLLRLVEIRNNISRLLKDFEELINV